MFEQTRGRGDENKVCVCSKLIEWYPLRIGYPLGLHKLLGAAYLEACNLPALGYSDKEGDADRTPPHSVRGEVGEIC